MHTTKISLNIESEKVLSFVDIYEILLNMKARLEGYSTSVPKQLENAEIGIDRKYSVDDIEYDLYNEVKKHEAQHSEDETSSETSG